MNPWFEDESAPAIAAFLATRAFAGTPSIGAEPVADGPDRRIPWPNRSRIVVGADPLPDAPASGGMTMDQAIALTPKWHDADFAALDQGCKEIGCVAEDILLVLTSESRLDPAARNPKDPDKWPLAVGLNQLTRIASEASGFTPKDDKPAWKKFADEYVKKSVAEQLPYVFKFYKANPYGAAGLPYHNAAKLYQANAAPSTLFLPSKPMTVLFAHDTDGFKNNLPLWILRKPQGIVFGDLEAAVGGHRSTDVYQAAVMRLRSVRGQDGPW